jgi:hypothetical protein
MAGLLDEIKKSQYLQMAEQKLQGLLNIPTEAQRFLTNPQAFMSLLGRNDLPQATGFAAGATGLTEQNIAPGGVLNPPNLAYQQGYEQGVPVGMLASIAPFTKGMPIGASIKDVSKMSPYVPGVRAGEEMFVQHNLSANKLYGADRLGGLPAPSLAISKLGNPLESFGDITLIGSKEMAQPSRINPTFKSDAYTKRAPEVLYNMDYKSEQNLQKMFGDLPNQLPRGKTELGNLVQDYGRRAENDIVAAKFLKEKGILPNPSEYSEKWKFSQDVRDLRRVNQNEFDQWLQNFDQSLPDQGVKIKEQIFKGYTPSGNRRYAEANIDNIVKEMKGGASSEGWNYGVGNLRAVATPQFKSLDQIKASRDRIVDSESFTVIKDQMDEGYNNILSRLREIDGGYDARDALAEAVEAKNLNVLDRIYKEVPKDLKADIGLYVNKLKDMPTEYFEIKPQRAVGIGEFQGALVPSDAPDRAIKILEDAGIKEIYQYGSPEEKRSLLERFNKEMFAGVPAIPIGGGLLGSEEE